MKNPKSADAGNRLSLSLVPPVALIETAKVLAAGNAKPGRWAWSWRETDTSLVQYLDAIKRHIARIESGEMRAADGLHHLAAVSSNCAILMDSEAAGTLVNDLPKVAVDAGALLDEYEQVSTKQSAGDCLPTPASTQGLQALKSLNANYVPPCCDPGLWLKVEHGESLGWAPPVSDLYTCTTYSFLNKGERDQFIYDLQQGEPVTDPDGHIVKGSE